MLDHELISPSSGSALSGEMAWFVTLVAFPGVSGESGSRVRWSYIHRGRNLRSGTLALDVSWLLAVVAIP